MVVYGIWKRHQYGRQARSAQFRHGGGSGAAQGHIGPGIGRRHVVNKGRHAGRIVACRRIGGTHRSFIRAACLVANVHPGFAQSGKVLHYERVESVRPLRPAHNQQTPGPSGSRQPSGLIDPGAHGIARKHALGGIKTFGVRQRQTDAPRQLCQHAVAGPGYGVLLMQHGRHAKQARGEHGGKGRITAKTGHNIRVKAPDNAQRLAN